MLPDTDYELNDEIETDFEEESYATRTFRMNTDTGTISGMCDGKEAIAQGIHCMLLTELGRYPIFSEDYGLAAEDLIGEEMDYARAELKDRITEALLFDERVISVDDFEFHPTGSSLLITCSVTTDTGEEVESEVTIDV
ncbi:hypothetical protein CXIVA_01660 [Clostridium sp. SY8519]|uniref:DUF2634 domain-containing protein n=1 Tax=Clostridium sp. (strain SY8519) TaxID=1042156 RepID=UPI0002171F6C|nr:DUF2634 domain-containing protein [Clostridium sp. SY8519]BAK46133.1 hypothetical protein CXIVA_01660 [Clostridium sp. SY8519]